MSVQKKVLIIDQKEKSRKFLAHFLKGMDFTVEETSSFSNATSQILNSNHYMLALIHMQPLTSHNLSLLRNIKSLSPGLGIVLLSNPESQELAISLIEKNVIDHVTSPDNLAAIFSTVKSEFQKTELIQKNRYYENQILAIKSEQQKNIKRTLDLEEIYDSTLENLMTALDLRDVETFGHSRSVAKYSQVLAQILGIKNKTILDNIRKGALLHDVGKIAIPDSILKKPKALTAREWEKIKLHPSLGFGLIKEIKLVKEVGNIILFHHERFDGTGYPKQLKSNNIPVEARIFALADALDAITSHRPYRKERDFQVAQREIQENSGTQFDPEVVHAFSSLSIEKWEKIRFETTTLIPGFEYVSQLKKQSE